MFCKCLFLTYLIFGIDHYVSYLYMLFLQIKKSEIRKCTVQLEGYIINGYEYVASTFLFQCHSGLCKLQMLFLSRPFHKELFSP